MEGAGTWRVHPRNKCAAATYCSFYILNLLPNFHTPVLKANID